MVFGDGLSDLGQAGSRYTVNDASVNIWTQDCVARSFGVVGLTPTAAGGTSLPPGTPASPEARCSGPALDAHGGRADRWVPGGRHHRRQRPRDRQRRHCRHRRRNRAGHGRAFRPVSRRLRTSAGRPRSGGAGAAAGSSRRLARGGRRPVQSGPLAVGRRHRTRRLSDASQHQVQRGAAGSIVDLGAKVLYVDAALFLQPDGVRTRPATTSPRQNAVCTSVDPGPGIGIGTARLIRRCAPPARCLPARTTTASCSPTLSIRPPGHRKFGEYAFDRIRSRW